MKIYENEKRKLMLYVMPAFSIMFMIILTVFRIVSPESWAKGGYLISMLFIGFSAGVFSLILYFFDIKARRKFNELKKLVTTNGIKTNGKIVDSLGKTVGYVNGEPSSFVYYAEIKLENGKKITTDALLINPKLCEEEVTVYVYEDKYYVTDFKMVNDNLKSNNRKTKKSEVIEESTYEPVSVYQHIITTISGAIFTAIMMWLETKAADNATRVILLPFFIAGMGVFLQGLLPLVFYKNQRIVANIGKKIYLFGFLLYWFGFLIVFDISAIRDKNIGMALFSLVFWAVGIWLLISNFKKK